MFSIRVEGTSKIARCAKCGADWAVASGFNADGMNDERAIKILEKAGWRDGICSVCAGTVKPKRARPEPLPIPHEAFELPDVGID